ncbi:MAG: hypothetical protein ABIP75_01045 [Pyrinomonadaceae bacterium]
MQSRFDGHWTYLRLRAAALASPRIGLAGIFVGALLLCFNSVVVRAQKVADHDTTRNLWDTAFKATAKTSGRSAKNPTPRKYRVVTPKVSINNVTADSVIGVTVWRLRPVAAADEGERIIVHEGASTAAWIPELVPGNAPLSEGNRVRLTIEAARTGYLYVIDREQYADGTFGEPLLVFPTTRTLGGNNQVQAGRLIDLPGQDDSPPFFTLKRSRTDQVGEMLTVIVTPEPLEELQIGDQAQTLSAKQVTVWEQKWGGQAGRLDLTEGRKRTWTSREKEAATPNGRLLSHAEPAPQMLFYRPGAVASQPLLIKVQLRYGSAGRRPRR